MNVCLVLLAVTLGCTGSPGQPRPGDHWVAEDKLRHFALSFAATAMTYGAARTLLDREPARYTATGLALTLGIAKEVHDVRTGGPFSLKDLTWDMAGVAVGFAFTRQTR